MHEIQMSNVQILLTIAIAAITTFATRSMAFVLFPKGKKIPDFVVWLGKALPMAVMAMLLVYCLKDISLTAPTAWIPAILGVAVTAGVHLWRKQMILSISLGTMVYMILLRIL